MFPYLLAALLKLLVPNNVAGALIGKGGTAIEEMQNKFGGCIRLSQNREHYPGTDERIVLLTGEIEQIIKFNNHIMEKVQEDRNKQPMDEGRTEQVKIVLTHDAAGLLIGSGGATIKAIQEISKAKINISNRDDSSVPGERVLYMSGSMDQRAAGCRLVIEKIAHEASNSANKKLKYTNGSAGNFGSLYSNRKQDGNNHFDSSYNNTSSGFIGTNNMGDSSNVGQSNQNPRLKTIVHVEMEVPDIMVGAILGKQGQIIHELMQFSGAKIQLSGKNEFAPGTNDRILTITGDMKQTQTAHSLVNQKVEQAEIELSNRRY